jgi:hypothetical protein
MSYAHLPIAWRHIWRHVVPNLLLNAVGPILVYATVRPHVSELHAVMAAAFVPLADGLVGIVRHRRINIVGVLVLLSLVFSGILVLLGGTPQLILARESVLSGAMGIVLLASLLWPQPLVYHLGQHFYAGNVPDRRHEFRRKARSPWFRSFLRLLTVVWGLVTVVQSGLCTYLALHLPVATFLIVSPVAHYGIMACTFAWTIAHAHRGQYLAYLFAPNR